MKNPSLRLLVPAALAVLLLCAALAQFLPKTEKNVSSEAGSVSEETAESSETVSETPAQPEAEWYLLLVNGEHPIPDTFTVELAEIENGYFADARIVEPLRQMLADARKAGILPKITSAYRTDSQQREMMDSYVDDYLSQGFTQEEAETEAANWVALPGQSEHQTGLAVDISTADWNAQSAYEVWEWLEANCTSYGFILRYTEQWQSVTGTAPEPWHFRYVGVEAAREIERLGICLETYVETYVETHGETYTETHSVGR